MRQGGCGSECLYGAGPPLRAAPREEKEFNADEEGCTQNTQMLQWGSKVARHAFDFWARLVDIERYVRGERAADIPGAESSDLFDR